MSGSVVEIFVAPTARVQLRSVEWAYAIAGRGLEGDRYADGMGTWSDYRVPGGKNLTLIEAEALVELNLAASEMRRNITTIGVSLAKLIGRRFRIGDVVCYGDRLCEPCTHLEQMTGKRLIAALAHRGGIRADVISSGEIHVGDRVIVLGEVDRS